MYQTFRDSLMHLIKKPFNLHRHSPTEAREEFWALRDVSFKVQQGERLGIIGRNGAGKSTLLKILSQIISPTAGEVRLRGKVASLLEVGTGFHPELTGRENIYLNGAILGMKQSEIRKKFDEIVAFAEIEKFLDTPVKRYSSGMYVRLAFAVAAHLEPEILIVDEVLAVGDMQFQKKCLGKMQEVSSSGRTIIFVSHNLGAIRQLCDTCILLEKGALTNQGPTDQVISHYIVSQANQVNYYEQPSNVSKAMNLRKVRLSEKSSTLPTISYDEDIVFNIEYEVNRKITNALVWVYLVNQEGVIMFNSTDYDLHPELNGIRLPGQYQTEFAIPKKLLNTGSYSLFVAINANNPQRDFDRVEALRFDLVDNGTTPKSLFHESSRNGVLQPFLDWKTKKLS